MRTYFENNLSSATDYLFTILLYYVYVADTVECVRGGTE